jgi:aldose 1-epimerase
MTFAVEKGTLPGVKDLDATVWILKDGAGAQATVWPALGFNCFQWEVQRGDQTWSLLHAEADLCSDPRPTRSGIPILFPFPNRIRDGRFTWAGTEYQLPINDHSKKNAIHGFACRRPWRVIDQGVHATSAWVTGAFQGSRDAPDCVAFWPGDYEIHITYRLGSNFLRLEATVNSPGPGDVPFGLGYHPYFRLPFTTGVRADECTVSVPARSYWALEETLPSGERRPVDAARDLNQPHRLADLQLDDILTDLPSVPPSAEGLCERAVIQGAPGAALRLFCSEGFREMVVFTPGNRLSIAVEPYTCVTDAVNLQARGVDAGWRVARPGQPWTGVVEMRI